MQASGKESTIDCMLQKPQLARVCFVSPKETTQNTLMEKSITLVTRPLNSMVFQAPLPVKKKLPALHKTDDNR
jgi:hypothetical protein